MRSRCGPKLPIGSTLGALVAHAIASVGPGESLSRSGLPSPRYPRERIIRMREVLHRVPVNRATIYKWMNEGRFPRQVALGANSAGWYESEVDAWIADPTGWRPPNTS